MSQIQDTSGAPIVYQMNPQDQQQQVAYQNVVSYDAFGQPVPVQPVTYM